MSSKRIYTIAVCDQDGNPLSDIYVEPMTSIAQAYAALGDIFVDLINRTERDQYFSCQFEGSSFMVSNGISTVNGQISIADLDS